MKPNPQTITDQQEEIQNLLRKHKWFNGGAGLIVSPHLGVLLKRMGIYENYLISKKVPRQQKPQYDQ